ncbi:MAG TPA: NADAR family protein [Pirellulaceae bacterium]|nr:NADAR family protein [Pirellulaceae bacterium]
MKWELGSVQNDDCVVVHKVSENFGGLSNMHNGYPLHVEKNSWRSSEALYQACRYPHKPQWQREIMVAPHAMRAKMAAKKENRRTHSRPDWNTVRVGIMRWCLRMKLDQHFGQVFNLLQKTGDRAIVEHSRRDRFWGAVLERDGVLRGENWLGRLWMELRDETVVWMQGEDEEEEWPAPEPPSIVGLSFLCGHVT